MKWSYTLYIYKYVYENKVICDLLVKNPWDSVNYLEADVTMIPMVDRMH